MDRKHYLYLAWIVALAGTVGSLAMSEVFHLLPCTLCWYQRIALFPLALILPAGILLQDKKTHYYALPLALFGLITAVYHWLIQFKIIPHSLTVCQDGLPCEEIQLQIFHIITIPAMSALAFTFIIISLILYANEHRS